MLSCVGAASSTVLSCWRANRHFSSATVLFDWLLACTNAMFIFNWIFFVFSRQRLDFDVNVEKFVEYYPVWNNASLAFSSCVLTSASS